MLDADARNCKDFLIPSFVFVTEPTAFRLLAVHAWNYRRYILANIPVRRSEASELAYTTRKIEANFSNFSAWHQRSKVLVSLWESGTLDPVKSKEEGALCEQI